MARTILYNAIVVSDRKETAGYVVVDDGFITKVSDGSPSPELLGEEWDEAIDLEGRYLLPGAIDEHVHFREPGLTDKGDTATESRAAIMGGVTSFIDMPNTVPATTTIEAWREKNDIAAGSSYANFGYFLGATDTNLHELLAADYSRVAGVKVFMGSSTGGMLVNDSEALHRIFADVKTLIAVHAEDEATIAKNRLKAIEHYGCADDVPVEEHSKIRSSTACLRATRYAVDLAKRLGTRLHVTHVSTAAELNLFRDGLDVAAKRITAETCPQYLVFTCADMEHLGARIKCNPAIKGQRDRAALRHALRSGRIDTIATDHAPHLLADKQGGALKATSGMPGVQFMLPVVLDLLTSRGMSVADVVRLLSHNPATIFRIDRRGFIREGYHADLAVVEKMPHPSPIADTDVASLCGWTPYAGIAPRFKVTRTIVNGVTMMLDGKVAKWCPAAQPLHFNRKKI